jgi:tripartite-type tricarboxylate transporter receptor subunit TctC
MVFPAMRKSSIRSEGGIAARRQNTFHMASIIAAMLVAGMALLVSIGTPTRADDVEDFYKGHSLSMIIGFGVGGGYDLYGRLVSRYMGKYLPGKPTVVPENMAGAGSLRAVDYLYSVAPKDGSVVGTFSRTLPLAPLLSGANFDSRKFTWLGSVAQDVIVCFTSRSSPIKTWQDLLTKPSSLGGEGAGAEPDIYARFVKNIFGAKVKLVSGYRGTNDIFLAVERGELDGVCGISWGTVVSVHPDYIRDGKINVIVQIGLRKSPDLLNVPTLADVAQSQEQQQIIKLIVTTLAMSRPFAAPPDIPADRKAALVAAFERSTQDPQFKAEAQRIKLDVDFVPAQAIDKLLATAYATPKALIAKTADAISK